MANFRPKIGQDATFAPTLIIFDYFGETNRMILKAKLYLRFSEFDFLVHCLLQGLPWEALGLWTQNHP